MTEISFAYIYNVTTNVLPLCLTMPWVGMQCVDCGIS